VGGTSKRVTQLVAIGYPETYLASLAMEQLGSLCPDLPMRHDRMATIERDVRGSYRIETNAELSAAGASCTMLWSVLFAAFYFVPVLDMRVGPDITELLEHVDRAGFDADFVRRVREMVRPGTSALFVLVSDVTTDEIVTALEGYGGTVLQADIAPDAERCLLEALAGRELGGAAVASLDVVA
jgi:uncharacterized membrane protein